MESESELPGVKAMSQESESVRVDQAASTLTPDRLLQFDPVVGFQK